MNYTVKASQFVKRQLKGTGKTYSNSFSFDEISKIAEKQLNLGNFVNGYRDGVVIIELSGNIAKEFICPLIKINNNTKLKASIVKRRSNEEPYIQIRAINGKNLNSDSVDLVLYRDDVLDETNERSTDGKWELIAFMAKPKKIKLPMGPITMMRNQLCLRGGTKGHYSSEQWAESVHFWQKYALLK